jgi:hypothetical protein
MRIERDKMHKRFTNMQLLNFKNIGDHEINDRGTNSFYDLLGFRYTFLIRPKSQYWRFGLRLAEELGVDYTRYKDNNVKHLEVCVGERKADVWRNANVVQLQRYNIPSIANTLYVCDQYAENREILFSIECSEKGKISITFKCEGCPAFSMKNIDVGNVKYIAIFAWADSIEFDLDCEVSQEHLVLNIELNPIKALTGQPSPIFLTVRNLSVLFGKNNSGKTSILVGACNAFMLMGDFRMDYLSHNRFYTVSDFSLDNLDETEQAKLSQQEGHRKRRSAMTRGQNENFDWISELSLQTEETRENILKWFKNNFEEWKFIETKKAGYTTGLQALVNGHHPIEQGMGARAAFPIIMQLFNPNVFFLAIDEPELGLEPAAQKLLYHAIKSASQGKDNFPKKHIAIATHSHLFLDREDVDNNFRVSKNGGSIMIDQLGSIDELQDAAFRLLGNNPSDLFFPENIIVVEGRSDEIFLKAVLAKMLAANLVTKKHISFHFLEGIDKASLGLEAIIQMLKTQSYVPVYRDKVCGLFDNPKTDSEKKRIESVLKFFGDNEGERFVTLDQAAIEYYYPIEIVNTVFNCKLDKLTFQNEVYNFLLSFSKRTPLIGKFIDEEITKVEFASKIAKEFLAKGRPESIDPIIINLLKHADSLSY